MNQAFSHGSSCTVFSLIAFWSGINISSRLCVGGRGFLIGWGQWKNETGLPSMSIGPLVTKFLSWWKNNKFEVEWAVTDCLLKILLLCWCSHQQFFCYVFNGVPVLLTKEGIFKSLDIYTVDILALRLNTAVALVNGSDPVWWWPFRLFSFSMNACDCRISSPQPTLF